MPTQATTQARTTRAQAKRISKITIRRMDDDSPDTSWMGEYSNKRSSEYSIDRAHAEDCQTRSEQTRETIEQLGRVLNYLFDRRRSFATNDERDLDSYEALDVACDIIAEKQDELQECDCNKYWSGREYRYFNPSFNYVDKDGHALEGNTPDDVRKYVKQDYGRMEGLQAGDWSFIGIRVEAEIVINSVCQTISSGGLWGIESDSDASYFKSVEQEELADLRTILYQLGFSKRAIAAAAKELARD